MTESERIVMLDHHKAMRRTRLAEAEEHKKMAEFYEGQKPIVVNVSTIPEGLIEKLQNNGGPGNLIPVTQEELEYLRKNPMVTRTLCG